MTDTSDFLNIPEPLKPMTEEEIAAHYALYENVPDLDGDKIVEIIRAAGFVAYVEQTGGGCATIYASREAETPDSKMPAVHLDQYGDERFDLGAGPGVFAGPGWTLPRFTVADFYIGLDDDGESTDSYRAVITDTEETLAAIIIERLRA